MVEALRSEMLKAKKVVAKKPAPKNKR